MQLIPSEKNVGGWDRTVRLIVGPVLLIVAAAALFGVVALGPVAIAASALVGLVFTVTGAVQKCPLNGLLGFDTYRGATEEQTEQELEAAERPA
ncbi:YgaP family membrane protein [Halobaculum litoreum]|uniref:DUF2892 domain-containing protein n=1 Tax=Halobaculum litoreum TaxID=3031998 RepID=A0ABD5XKP5_9EURY|nr:DUF2892 domain-containing protein [Halobaculum sp. DT92]